jgi:hypothetical protein
VDAKVLILNHISSKSDRNDVNGDSNQLQLIKDAKESSNGKSDVLVSYDFMELLVPWLGFGERIEVEEPSNPAAESARDENGQTVESRKIVKQFFGKLFGDNESTK